MSVHFPTERQKTLHAENSVHMHGAKYFVDPVAQEVAVLPVRIWVGENDDEPGGHFRLKISDNRGPPAPWNIYCHAAIDIPNGHQQFSLLAGMFEAHENFSPPKSVLARKIVAFSCTLGSNHKEEVDDAIQQINGGRSEGCDLEWPITDFQFSIEEEDYDKYGSTAFVTKNDFGLIEDQNLLNYATRWKLW